MVDDLEVYCPECGKLFNGERKMLRHIERDHVSKKKNSKSLVLALDARYLGGHPSFTSQTNGILSLYSEPLNKVVFESDEFTYEIPISSITKTKMAEGRELDGIRALMLGIASPIVGAASLLWRKTNKIFYIEFQDYAKDVHTVVFDHSDSMDEFADKLKKKIPTNKVAIDYKSNKKLNPISQKIEDPLHIIKVRYAKGEITKEQYEEMKKTLSS